MCVGNTELESGARPTVRGCQRDILKAHGGDKKNGFVVSVVRKHGTWVDR